MQTTLSQSVYTEEARLYVAFELGDKSWKLLFGDGTRKRSKTVTALSTVEVLEEIEKARERFKLPAGCAIISCYEAGWEGFWLHRWLSAQGVSNHVVDSAAIEVSRRRRHKKTDRIDAEKLLAQLLRYVHGERGALSVVRVPGDADEDARRLHRERSSLVAERGRHWVRIKSLLRAQGLRVERKSGFLEQLARMRRFDGSPVPEALGAEIEREWARHELVDGQIKALERVQRERLGEPEARAVAQAARLMQLRSLGPQSAWILAHECFGWREFRNRRELAALAGLTPTPYQSGASAREQGISKAGNRRLRCTLIELAWLWLRYQPESELSYWYCERFAGGGKRQRRIGIVALARKLLIALWRYLEHGELPAGALMSA